MKINNKKITKIVFICIIIISIFSVTSFGENQTANNISNNATTINTTNTQETQKNVTNSSNSASSTNKTKVNNNTSKAKKSSNANLSNLGIKPNDFSGFSENKTSYSTTVPNSVTEVEVYATKKDNKATVTGTGKKQLQEGTNTVNVVVTAEDGTTKTYTINIKRLKEGEKETATQNTKNGLGLSELKIDELNLEPSFSTEVYKYTVELKGDKTALEITANANESNSKVEIIGNENLIDGQNVITILVTDSKETEVITYQVFVNKNMVDQEELNKQLEESQRNEQIKKWTIRILIIIIVIGIIVILRIRSRRKKLLERNSDEDELPKSLRKQTNEQKKKDKKNKKNKRGKRYK